MPSPSRVIIVLATYQGADHLPAQIASLQRQNWTDWRLLVRDDGSTDGTIPILRAAAAEDRRIEILCDSRRRLGVSGNFGALLSAARSREAEFVFCCDQDDVWHPEKVERQLTHLRAVQSTLPDGMPILGHCDVQPVGPNLEPLGRSLVEQLGGLPSGADQLPRLLTSNFVTGCTMVLNRELLELVTPLPHEVVLHDWWCALCAVLLGRIAFLPEPLLRYRQHGGNVIGGPAAAGWIKRCRTIPRRVRRFANNLTAAVNQLQAAQRRIDEYLADPDPLDLSRPYPTEPPVTGRRRCLGQREEAHCKQLKQFLLTMADRPSNWSRFTRVRAALSEQQTHGLKWSIRNLLACFLLAMQSPRPGLMLSAASEPSTDPRVSTWSRAA